MASRFTSRHVRRDGTHQASRPKARKLPELLQFAVTALGGELSTAIASLPDDARMALSAAVGHSTAQSADQLLASWTDDEKRRAERIYAAMESLRSQLPGDSRWDCLSPAEAAALYKRYARDASFDVDAELDRLVAERT